MSASLYDELVGSRSAARLYFRTAMSQCPSVSSSCASRKDCEPAQANVAMAVPRIARTFNRFITDAPRNGESKVQCPKSKVEPRRVSWRYSQPPRFLPGPGFGNETD